MKIKETMLKQKEQTGSSNGSNAESNQQNGTRTITESEIANFNQIDKLTSFEISEGNKVSGVDEVNHDGVDLSINGSELDEDFPESEANSIIQDEEPG